MEEHREIVAAISRAASQFHQRGQKFRISHGSTNSTRDPGSKGTRFIDTSRLSRVLSVDVEKQTALVEPNVPMDRLVEATLPHGLIPPVVMEFPGITVGGGFAGTSGESSSFRHGFFDRTISRAEVVLGNGEVVEATRDEREDLLHGAAGAVGTLGITTLVELQLVKAKKFVLAKYHPVKSPEEAVEVTRTAIQDPDNDYVDGILFSRTSGAIITGSLSDACPDNVPVQTFSAPQDPWFYMHVRDQIGKAGTTITEAIPLAEYLFRYDRGGFWVGESAFKYFHMPFSRWTRRILDDFLHTRMLYKALHASGHATRFMIQDLALPIDNAVEFIKFTHEKLAIYPLWLCPLRQSPLPTMHPHDANTDVATGQLEPLLNVGVWGYGPRKRADFIQANLDLEEKLRELRGMKWLYAHAYYDEQSFWGQFNRDWYTALRAKYHATNLPDVYEKVRVAADPHAPMSLRERIFDVWPIAGIYGLRKAIASKAYQHARESTWKASSSR